jgi:16S rRNA (uracil1498-N3)-methyltransferase
VASPRFFIVGDLPPCAALSWHVPLAAEDLHHAMHVLRIAAGDRIVLADVRGREAEATVVRVEDGGVVADVDEPVAIETGPEVALAQGMARRERMEFVVQKATEVGVAEVLPVTFERSVVHMDPEKRARRADRWRRIAEEAAKQSQRPDVPAIHEPTDLAGLLEYASTFDLVLVPWEEEPATSPGIAHVLRDARATPETSVLVVVGPEGGLTSAEVDALRAAGGRTLTLGSRVLRTETAAVVAVALVLYELGALGGAARDE